MKRLIPLCTLLLFILASCDSPVSQLSKDKDTNHSKGNISDHLSYNPLSALADTNRQAVWQQFKGQYGPEWKMTWSEKTGTPLTVFSGTAKSIPGSPEQVARTFLEKNLSLFNMRTDLSDLQLLEVDISSRGNQHVRFQQTHKGVRVYEADYQVHIRPDGRIDMANGHYYPNIELSTSPSVSASSAIQVAESDLGGQPLKKNTETELMIFRNPETKTFVLAWSVTIAEEGLYWQYFVDAAGGQILKKQEMITDITGDGDIITETSCTTPNPANRNLYRLDGSGYLRGTYANVHNEETGRAFSSVSSFQYDTDNTHFEEVNVYYHIDTFRDSYLNNIGFAGEKIGSDQDLEAHVHDPNFPANYIFSQEAVRFGDPPDFALQDEVIYHEFTHAVADAINGSHRLDPVDDEEGAIGEGTADYFPGSFTGDALIGGCVLVQPRDMENPDIIHYDDLLRDNEGNVIEPMHNGGEFFSAILWDLRNDGGISIQEADEIIFEAIRRLSGSPTFIEYRDAMMAVDSDVNGGVHNDLIQDTFAARGVGNPATPPPDFSFSVTIMGPTSLSSGEQGTWSASVSNGSSPYSYQWQRKLESESYWYIVGNGSSYTGGESEDFDLKVIVTDSGNNDTSDQIHVTASGAIPFN